MNQDVVSLRKEAFEEENISLAKEIENIENQLVIERNALLQRTKTTSKKTPPALDELNLSQSESFKILENKYVKNISHYKSMVNADANILEKSNSLGRIGDGQIIVAGEQATVSLKTTSLREEVIAEVLNAEGTSIATSYTHEQTDYPSYTWTTSEFTLPGTYSIVIQYPGTSEVEDTFTVIVAPVGQLTNSQEDIPVNIQVS